MFLIRCGEPATSSALTEQSSTASRREDSEVYRLESSCCPVEEQSDSDDREKE